jgi:hypothetical protein
MHLLKVRTPSVSMLHSRATLRQVGAPSGFESQSDTLSPRGAERRTERRFTPSELRSRILARHKYGEPVTLIDLSVGGVQFETPRLIRPDIDVVLEIIDSRTREISRVVSRVLRANVAALTGGVKYRAAAAFKRPLSNAALLVPAPEAARPAAPDYLKLELELRTIVEGHFNRPSADATRRHDVSSPLDALAHLRLAAERRRDPIDRQLGALLAAMIPALQRRAPAAEVLRTLQNQLAEQLPVRAIRTGDAGDALVPDCESITLNMCLDANAAPMAITAEFPSGFGLDASQFRLLKLSAYLVGMIERWDRLALTDAEVPSTPHESRPQTLPAAASEPVGQSNDLPSGMHRVVLRCLDGPLLHGYSNDFSSDRACFQFSPSVGCPAAERMLVPISRLKAVFFVKDLRGDAARVDTQTFDHVPRGRKVQVTFRDGEVMTGSTLNYKPNGQGFYLLPANTGGNNVRVYVVTAAIKHIRFV